MNSITNIYNIFVRVWDMGDREREMGERERDTQTETETETKRERMGAKMVYGVGFTTLSEKNTFSCSFIVQSKGFHVYQWLFMI